MREEINPESMQFFNGQITDLEKEVKDDIERQEHEQFQKNIEKFTGYSPKDIDDMAIEAERLERAEQPDPTEQFADLIQKRAESDKLALGIAQRRVEEGKCPKGILNDPVAVGIYYRMKQKYPYKGEEFWIDKTIQHTAVERNYSRNPDKTGYVANFTERQQKMKKLDYKEK